MGNITISSSSSFAPIGLVKMKKTLAKFKTSNVNVFGTGNFSSLFINWHWYVASFTCSAFPLIALTWAFSRLLENCTDRTNFQVGGNRWQVKLQPYFGAPHRVTSLSEVNLWPAAILLWREQTSIFSTVWLSLLTFDSYVSSQVHEWLVLKHR